MYIIVVGVRYIYTDLMSAIFHMYIALCSARDLSSTYVSADARFELCEAPFISYRGSGNPIHTILSHSLLCPSNCKCLSVRDTVALISSSIHPFYHDLP